MLTINEIVSEMDLAYRKPTSKPYVTHEIQRSSWKNDMCEIFIAAILDFCLLYIALSI